MPDKKYIMAMDQGTTSSRCIIFDLNGRAVGSFQKEFEQIFPQPGYVEHNPMEILSSQLDSSRMAMVDAGVRPDEIIAIGITNQRETVVAWQRSTGKPVYNAIVWQCRRSAPFCEKLKNDGTAEYIKEKTGLIVDAYFSGTKMKWILDNVPEAARLNEIGDLCFGTVDSWLLWNLTGGRVHATDITNASRTMLFDIHRRDWDSRLLDIMGVSKESLPEVKASAGYFGTTVESIFGAAIPVTGIAGDQHAATFGQCCFETGSAKNTYGTGCFILMNTGEQPIESKSGLLTTVCWQLGDKVTYALEGSAFNAGSAIKWLRDELHIIESAQQADRFAEEVEDSCGLSFVPAFTGLGAPYWDMYARGVLLGITRGTSNKHIARAVLESIALQCYDLFKAMEKDSGIELREIKVDGGVSNSRFVMQLQSDLLGLDVIRPDFVETTALGAAYFAGIGAGVWNSLDELRAVWKLGAVFKPAMSRENADKQISLWHKAVERSMGWATEQ